MSLKKPVVNMLLFSKKQMNNTKILCSIKTSLKNKKMTYFVTSVEVVVLFLVFDSKKQKGNRNHLPQSNTTEMLLSSCLLK